MVNSKSQVLNENDEVIEGLYAIGNVSGGLYAVDYPTICNANSMGRCLTFGYLVGRELAGLE
ncbi:FAD-binding protein [Eggerthella lenta]|uniref:FAD-binding protein n=1 Tax=Eggerthella lenta TaxID=84112 RepID=UPI0027DF0BD6|nr:FAD-binding protein [Eggerthella lenta]